MLRLAGKLALITGGSSGIGFATAKAFIKEGAHVAITGRNRETLEAARLALGSDTLAVQSDASDLAAIDALFAAIKERFGALDILFANAGIAGGHAVEETTEAEFDRIFAVNVKGVFFTVQKALPLMRRGGSIVLNSSIGYRTGRPYLSLYAASKAAVRTFARNFSTEFAARGLRVNVVSPGAIDTPIWDHWREPSPRRLNARSRPAFQSAEWGRRKKSRWRSCSWPRTNRPSCSAPRSPSTAA
jgi:NAD(P)-dependent dehydrogenase (short-subunit alcohol dehydrogenase family)